MALVTDALADHALGTEAQLAWRAQLLKVDQALARDDFAAAEMLWREAYAAALKSRHWEGMLATGDARRVAAQSKDPRADEHLRAFTERWAASALEMDYLAWTP